MFRSIIVPLDGSPLGEKAMHLATVLARKSGADLKLVHVVSDNDNQAAANSHTLRDYLSLVAWKCRAVEGIPATESLLHGAVSTTLVKFAGRSPSDLIVMSTHGRGSFSRWWLGSVAEVLMRESQLPMLVIRPGRNDENGRYVQKVDFRRILIALDGSPEEDAAIEMAGELALLFSAGVHLFHVVEMRPIVMGDGVVFIPNPDTAFIEESTIEAQARLSAAAERLRGRGLTATFEVIAREAVAPAILEAAATADLVVLASHGRGRLGRMLLGSVADKVVRAAECPVLLVRRSTSGDDK